MSRVRRPRIHAVILAGGAGTRFWPLSRTGRPKPLLRIGGRDTLLSDTLSRARRVAASDRIWVVCGEEHARAVGTETGLPRHRLLVEPAMRNTAAAIAIAAARIQALDPEAVLAILPADHRIPDRRAFAAAVRTAARTAAREDALVTLGVRPSRPETGYGYIRISSSAGGGPQRVTRFVEKPDRARARRYWRSGLYLWNAGIFVWTARRLLAELEAWAPEVHGALGPVFRAAAGRDWTAALRRAYRRVPALPIDKAVLEHSGRVWCLPVDFHWSDVGSWQSLAEELGVGEGVSRVMDGEALLYDSGGSLVYAHDRPIVLLGVEGVAVVDSGDALLVASLERSPEVRQVVSLLRAKGRCDVL